MIKPEAIDDYNVYSQEFHRQKTVWAAGCWSWYKNRGSSDGPVTDDFRTEDFHIDTTVRTGSGSWATG